MKIQEFL